MPDWKIHSLASLLAYSVILFAWPLALDLRIMALLAMVFSGLLPDLDHPRSLMRQALGVLCSLFVSLMFFVSLESPGLGLRVLSSMIIFLAVFLVFRKLPLSHRGRRSLHRWGLGLIIFLASLALFYLLGLSPWLGLFILAGYWLHLGLDRVKYKR